MQYLLLNQLGATSWKSPVGFLYNLLGFFLCRSGGRLMTAGCTTREFHCLFHYFKAFVLE